MTKAKNTKNNSPTHKILWVGLVILLLLIPLVMFFTSKQDKEAKHTKQTEHQINQSLEQATKQDDSDKTSTMAADAVPTQGASIADLQAIIEEQGRLSITGKPIDRESLNSNKAKLMDELKAKKRTINHSTMSPLMALEYEQFGRYLDRGQFDMADQLLTDMQESWPEFDFEEMIYRLALAETETNQ